MPSLPEIHGLLVHLPLLAVPVLVLGGARQTLRGSTTNASSQEQMVHPLP